MHVVIYRATPPTPRWLSRSSRVRAAALAALAALLVGATGAIPAGAARISPGQPGRAALRPATAGTHEATLARAFGALPLSFEPNRGQADRGIGFLARGNGYSVALAATGATLTMGAAADAVPTAARPAVVRMTLLGANPAAQGQGQGKRRGTVGYMFGRTARTWLLGIPTYAAVRYTGVYPGVDLLYYGNGQRLEYDFRLARGADPGRIRLAFQGAAQPAIAANGDLLLRAAGSVVRQHRPVIYQFAHGVRRQIAGSYVLTGHAVGIRVGTYDRQLPLVIDPLLVYATYYGGSGADRGNGIAVDGRGNVYIVGITTSGFKAQTAFVAKIDASGTPLWVKFINNDDSNNPNKVACASTGNGIVLDGQGNAYVTGMYGDVGSDSWDNNLCVSKVVLWAKFDPSGNASFATFGTYDTSKGNAIAVDGQGNSYITGQTDQTAQNFPVTAGAFQTTPGISSLPSGCVSGDAFVLKLDPSGNVVYGTFLGGCGIDEGLGIAVDDQGDAFVVGTTGGTTNGLSNFPITNSALQTQPGNLWAPSFMSELSPDGSALLYSTFLSGNNGEAASGVAVDGQGYVYVVGNTNSSDFPVTSNAYKTTCGTNGLCNPVESCWFDWSLAENLCHIYTAEDIFVAKFDLRQAGAASLIYSTYLGGSNRDIGQAIAVDGHGNAYITGRTASVGDFPTQLGPQPAIGGDWDAFVAKLDTTQSGAASLVYATYLGGSHYDEGDAIAIDAAGDAYVTGYTTSTDFPTQSPSQATNNGGESDAFIVKLGPQAPIVLSGLALNPGSLTAGQSSRGTVTLNAPAPAGGATISLASANPAATVPASIVVPAGATSVSFTVSTQAVGAPTAVTITAGYNGVSQTATLTVNPAPPSPTATQPVPTQAPPSPSQAPPPTQAPLAQAPPMATPVHPATPMPPSPTPPASAPATPASAPATPATPASASGSHVGQQPGTAQGGSSAGKTTSLSLALVLGHQPAQVRSGSTLVVSGRTMPHAQVSAAVQVTATRMTVQGTRVHRKRVAQAVVLYRAAQHGSADRSGRFTLRLRLAHVPHVPARAALTVRASAGRRTAMRTIWIVIQPARAPRAA